MSDQLTPDQMAANMLRKELYVITTTPAQSAEIKKLLPAHLKYQVKLEREGKLFGGGPYFEEGEDIPLGGMIILRAKSIAEARELADAELFHAVGLRTYTLRKWVMNEGSMTFTVRYSDQSVVVS